MASIWHGKAVRVFCGRSDRGEETLTGARYLPCTTQESCLLGKESQHQQAGQCRLGTMEMKGVKLEPNIALTLG